LLDLEKPIKNGLNSEEIINKGEKEYEGIYRLVYWIAEFREEHASKNA
jgi:hypothetical protein